MCAKYVCRRPCYASDVEVRGQLYIVGSLCAFQGSTSGHQVTRASAIFPCATFLTLKLILYLLWWLLLHLSVILLPYPWTCYVFLLSGHLKKKFQKQISLPFVVISSCQSVKQSTVTQHVCRKGQFVISVPFSQTALATLPPFLQLYFKLDSCKM